MPRRRNHDREPVGHTCPDVDGVISAVSRVSDMCDMENFASKEDAEDTLNRMIDALHCVRPAMERLRTNNSTLREWGNQEAGRVDELETELLHSESKLDSAKQRRDELLGEVSVLHERVRDLESEVHSLREEVDQLRPAG